MLARIKIPALAIYEYILGRVVPMRRKPGILFASRYLTWLGRIFLREPIVTHEEDEAKKGGAKTADSLGPVPAYMRDEAQWWITDRTVKEGPDHINGAILMTTYRNKSYKDLSGRVFLASLILCTSISILDGSFWSASSWVSSMVHRATYAARHIGSSNKPHDDTADLFPKRIRDAIAAAEAAKTPISDAQQANANNTDQCSAFFAGLILDQGRGLDINNLSTMVQAARKLDNCHKAGFTYNAALVGTLQPFRDAYGPNAQGKWGTLLQASTLPGTWTPLSDFSTCDATLKNVLASPSATDFTAVHAAADCLSHGSTLPTDDQDD